jgi:uncharacterized protein YcbX
VITSSTLEELEHLQPETRFDVRRFRMNVVVNTDGQGFVENDWLEKALTVGENVVLGVAMPDPRCVMTTLAQDDLAEDAGVLRTLVKHNRLPVAGAGAFPCAGVYAAVVAHGNVNVGDEIRLVDGG